MKNISELLDLHVDLDAMFLEHQRALLRFDLPRALKLLNRYEGCLFLHMRDEEEILLPIYEQRAVIERGGNAQLFLDEHEKMRGFLELFKDQIEILVREEDPDTRLLLLLDREAFYKRLCTHHDMREQQHLYRLLDMVLSDSEKEDLLERVTWSFEVCAF